MENKKIFGKRLALARTLLGFTQETILECENFPSMDLKTLSRCENGKFRGDRPLEIASFFNLTPWPFFDDRLEETDFLQLIYHPEEEKLIHKTFCKRQFLYANRQKNDKEDSDEF